MNDMDNMTANSDVQRLDFNTPALQRKRRIRALKDHLARWYVSIGGLAVLGAITLIFFYLAQVVLPMFQGAELEARKAQQPAWLADAGKPLYEAVVEAARQRFRPIMMTSVAFSLGVLPLGGQGASFVAASAALIFATASARSRPWTISLPIRLS